jgi:molybdopterin-binding protein
MEVGDTFQLLSAYTGFVAIGFSLLLLGGEHRPLPDCHDDSTRILRSSSMISARNQFKGTVRSVKLGNVMAEVVIAVGDLEVVSAVTRGSVDQMGIKVGDSVVAVIKSTEVMIQKN